MRKTAIFFVLIIIFSLVVAKLFLMGRLAAAGVDLGRIEKESFKVSEESRVLEEKIVELSALTRVSSEAAKLGLVSNSQRVNMKLEIPVAFRGPR